MHQASVMTKKAAIDTALAFFNDGRYVEELSRRVAIRTESQKPEQRPELYRYLEDEIAPAFEAMGHECWVYENPEDGKGPVLLATRIEDEALPVGKMIAIKPNDYGQEETVGEIVWVTAEALAVKRIDEQVGDVLVHYPRLGYLFEARA